jgi:hypothetical protein
MLFHIYGGHIDCLTLPVKTLVPFDMRCLHSGDPLYSTIIFLLMKKIVLFLSALALLACARTPLTQEVTFKPTLVETGSMTRATNHSEILDLIESTYTPFAVDLYTNEEANQFIKMEFGRTYTVPIGTFKVTGYNSITQTGSTSGKYTIGKSPSFYTQSYVTIEYGTQEYAIPIEVRSAAIVIDLSEVYQVAVKGKSGSYITFQNSDFVYSDHYGVFFINGYFSGADRVEIMVMPKTGANKETEFILCADSVNTGGSTYAQLEMGKYYVLHPNPITELSGVSFSMDIPNWECGLD